MRIGQSAGNPIGVMPPYSIPEICHGFVRRGEGGGAHIQPAAHHSVHVGSGCREHHARREAHLAAAPALDDDAVGRGIQRHAVARAELSRVGQCRVDRRDAYALRPRRAQVFECGGDRRGEEFGMPQRGLCDQRSGREPLHASQCRAPADPAVFPRDCTCTSRLRVYPAVWTSGCSLAAREAQRQRRASERMTRRREEHGADRRSDDDARTLPVRLLDLLAPPACHAAGLRDESVEIDVARGILQLRACGLGGVGRRIRGLAGRCLQRRMPHSWRLRRRRMPRSWLADQVGCRLVRGVGDVAASASIASRGFRGPRSSAISSAEAPNDVSVSRPVSRTCSAASRAACVAGSMLPFVSVIVVLPSSEDRLIVRRSPPRMPWECGGVASGRGRVLAGCERDADAPIDVPFESRPMTEAPHEGALQSFRGE